MTSTAPQPVSLVPSLEDAQYAATKQPPESAQPWGATLCWDLAARAGARLTPDEHTGHPPDHAVAIELTIEPTPETHQAAVRVDALLRSGNRIELRHLVSTSTRWSGETGFDSIDIEGVVSCTFRASDRTPTPHNTPPTPPTPSTSRPIYARCPLLATLGIPGGAYSLRTGHAHNNPG